MHFILSYFHELKHQKLRMFLTIMAVAWGMTNIALMLSVGEGLHRVMHRGMSGMGEGIVVCWLGQSSKEYRGFGTGRPVNVTEEDIREAANLNLISDISGEYNGWGVQIRHGDKISSKNMRGVHPCYGRMRNLVPEQGGRFFNELDEKKRRRVIFIGNEVRDSLFGKNTNPVGETLMMNDIPFTVIGVMRDKHQTSCYMGMDKHACFIPASTFRTMFNRSHVDLVVIAPPSEKTSKDAQTQFRKFIAARHGFHPEDEELFSYWDTFESQKMQQNMFIGLKIFLGIIGGLTLLIAGMGVANIMYVTIKERTREIGIKMAIGAHPLSIVMQFLIEAVLTVSIGGALGIGMVSAIIKLFSYVPMSGDFIEVVGRPEPVFSGLIALVCITILNIVGLMAGVFPARRAAIIDPVEALRHE